MKNFISEQEDKIKKIIIECGYDVDNVQLVVSSRTDLGQYQYNGVMQLAKTYKKNPKILAEEIVKKMINDDYLNVNIAGPGFINITFSDEIISKYMEKIRRNSENNLCIDKKKKIIIDYGGPNVAKILHVGHLRSANIGEALKRLAATLNCEVISDVHLGDWGRQMGLIILELKKLHPEWVYFDEMYSGKYPRECPIKNSDLEKLYPIASLKANNDEQYLEEARIITAKLQHKEKGYYELWKQIVAASVTEIKKIYNRLNVSFDLWNGESDADRYVQTVIDYLKKQGFVYESNGAIVMDVSLPDDTCSIPPLILIKSNGAVSYETTDLASLWERMHNITPDEIWYVVDKRQELHFKQVFRAAYKSGIVPKNVKLDFIGFGTMNGRDGRPFKTRDGSVMTLLSLIETVKNETLKKLNPNIIGREREKISDIIAVGALKYADLLPNRTTDYIFNEERFSDLNGKTGVYILYSTIRIKSLLDKARDLKLQIGPVDVIVNEYDRNVALKLLEIPNILNKAFDERTLNDIAEYLYQLTNAYNNFYSFNKILLEKRRNVRQSWLGLSQNVYEMNEKLLDILGIIIPDKM